MRFSQCCNFITKATTCTIVTIYCTHGRLKLFLIFVLSQHFTLFLLFVQEMQRAASIILCICYELTALLVDPVKLNVPSYVVCTILYNGDAIG